MNGFNRVSVYNDQCDMNLNKYAFFQMKTIILYVLECVLTWLFGEKTGIIVNSTRNSILKKKT